MFKAQAQPVKKLPTCCHLCGQAAPAKLGADWALDWGAKWLVCPQCFSEGRALRGDASRQNYEGIGGPIAAFWDQTRQCGTCSKSYVFGAAEQKYWYESLVFFVESAPLECPGCRKETRARKLAQKTLQELLPLPAGADWRQCEKVARAAARIGGSKALEYLRRAKNLCDQPQEKARLEAEIATFEPAPPMNYKPRVSPLIEQLRPRSESSSATPRRAGDARLEKIDDTSSESGVR